MRGIPGSKHLTVGSSLQVVSRPACTFASASSLYTSRSAPRPPPPPLPADGAWGTAAVARVLPTLSPYRLTPPPCHAPVKSGLPSAVRGIGFAAAGGGA